MLVPALRPLSKKYRTHQVQMLLVWEILGKRGCLYGKPLETACMACKLGGTGSEGITRAGQRVTARLIETQIWHTPASSVGGWSQEKEQWPLPKLPVSMWLLFYIHSHRTSAQLDFRQFWTMVILSSCAYFLKKLRSESILVALKPYFKNYFEGKVCCRKIWKINTHKEKILPLKVSY